MKKILAILSVSLLLTSSIVFAHTNHATSDNHKHECSSIQRIQAHRWYFCENCDGYTEHQYNSKTGDWYCIECTMLPPAELER